MKITKITVQKNDPERYNIFVGDQHEERFACGVDQELLLRHHLHKGMEVDEKKLAQWALEDEYEKAYKHALHYVNRRMRTEQEVRLELANKEVIMDHIDRILEAMKERKYVNDHMYAKSYVNLELSTSSKGPGRMKQYLEEKGVARSTIEGALLSYTKEQQLDKAIAVIQKKSRQYKKDSIQMKKKKLTDALLRLGFSYEMIQLALEHLPKADEEDALSIQAKQAAQKLQKKYSGQDLHRRIVQKLVQKGFSYQAAIDYVNESFQEEDQ
ncbi:RecX family transcriptional regulator [Geomicrobium sediminis]|uniref:Regulatory protein RecX n=1 Tax=Geomicrobium sediminis TaxID=1347788 RepID=A0ABS2PH98_9BACL|nr:RecX family transcriptional regulator [Geomicrobium sediminis]MBM7634819.1 regulatory protein [Geomicrobium sediminis]